MLIRELKACNDKEIVERILRFNCVSVFEILAATSKVISLGFPSKISDAINLSVNTAYYFALN